ncbi:caspase-6 [Hydra vulgaris]|uniref:caspase-6 n=1 Tax=Hydra vulgaris TaxID=6087 RepID=UPI001F5F30F6|nr:caspase-6 [Hydra vulgaris]
MIGEKDEYIDDNNNVEVIDENNNQIICFEKSSILVSDAGLLNTFVNISNKNIFNKIFKCTKRQIFLPEPNSIEKFQQHYNEDIYPINTYPIGKLLILNYSNFQTLSLKNYPRKGSEKDVERLKCLFLKLGFVVELFENLTTSETITAVAKSTRCKQKFSCFFVAILSHGLENEFFTADDKMQIDKIATLFKIPKLAGIPKIFLIQACQGFISMESNKESTNLETADYEDFRSHYKFVTLPTEEDVVYAFATVFGFRSVRNTLKGSWFIQNMCDVISQNVSKMDFLQMLTKVNAKLSLLKSKPKDSKDDEDSKEKSQVGSFVSYLTKEFYFCPPHGH